MKSARPPRCARVVLVFALTGIVWMPVDSTRADVLAEREAALQRYLASGQTSPAVVVDGAPRALPDAAPSPSDVVPSGRGADTAPPRDRAVTGLTTTTSEAGMKDPLGGDDVIIATSASFATRAYLQIASDGTCFVAMHALGDLYVYRSTDNGENWTLWSTLSDPAGDIPSASHDGFLVVEGAADRALFAYVRSGNVYVAYADIHAGSPVWTIVTAMTEPGVVYLNFAGFHTDAAEWNGYFVYVVAQGSSGGHQHTYFARSIDQGTGYEAEYRVADSTPTTQNYVGPRIVYGNNGFLHVAFRSETIGDSGNAGVLYLRASSFANGGIGAWSAPQPLVAPAPGANATVYGMSASTDDGGVYVLLATSNPLNRHYLHYSTDQGATWPVSSQVEMPEGGGRAPRMLPFGELVYPYADAFAGPGGVEHRVVLSRSTSADPSSWTGGESMSSPVTTGAICTACLEGCETSPALGDRVATVWVRETPGEREIRFDAEWRRDPGYPNTDIGFPIPVTGGGQTPPAIAEVDGDPELEIVFGTRSGDIHVRNHDGTAVPGWPVNIGSVPYDAPVAVGDLVGNLVPAIVAGNDEGVVYAFAPDGSLLPGWPVTMDEVAPVYVSIGALGPPHPRYVVALCGHEMRVIRYDGTDAAPAWGTFTETLTRPAAIGDTDGDGVTEIVTLKGGHLHIHNLQDSGAEVFRNFPGEVFSDAPTLADFELDGTLEILAPTVSGKMYLLRSNGTDYSASWPINVSPGVALTSAAIGQILGSTVPEIVFAEADGDVHVRYLSGIEQTGYPLAAGGLTTYMPPMLSPVSVFVSNVNIGTTSGASGTGWSWRNIPSAATPGWPRNLPGPVEETFASGDIDNDGRNELVVLGVDFLSVYDVGEPPATAARNHWPMYGYNAQRTGCLDCPDILTGVGDAPYARRSASLTAHPNPFNPATTIEYEVARAGRVSLEIFDVGGRSVAKLVHDEPRQPGRYTLVYHARGASGVYFARLRTADGEVTRKIVLLK